LLAKLYENVNTQKSAYFGMYLNKNVNPVNKEKQKMAKSARKKAKAALSAKKSGKTEKGQSKAAEYVSHLLELHKLQGMLLAKLDKEV